MEEWHAKYHGQPGPEWETFLQEFSTLWEEKRLELAAEHTNDGRFGMSKAGGCTRASALKLLDYDSKPFSGSTFHTFFIGHLVELEVVATLRAMGYPVNGQQEPVRIDPFMHSYSDGIMHGVEDLVFKHTDPFILSVKSTGYKMGGKKGKKFERRGFAELPFEGVRRAQPGHWAQLQAEMHGSGIHLGLYLVVAKDVIKAFEDDEYLGDQGNGSLSFYAEVVPYSEGFAVQALLPTWEEQWYAVQDGNPGLARFLSKTQLYADLKIASQDWMPNADRTESFNPCMYCDMSEVCGDAG